jgi:subtilisin family serine protease
LKESQNIFLSLPIFQILVVLYSTIKYPDKVDPKLYSLLSDNEEVEFLVLLKNNIIPPPDYLSKSEKAYLTYQRLRDEKTTYQFIENIIKSEGELIRSYWVGPILHAYGDAHLIHKLSGLKQVEMIVENGLFKVEIPIVGEKNYLRNAEPEWGIQKIKADSVWNMGYKGQGVIVAGEDTGVEWFHPAIKDKYKGYDVNSNSVDHNYNWHDAIHEIDSMHNDSIVIASNNPCGLDSMEPCDDHSHGTHTVGTAVGGDSELIIGVAPEAKWIGCRCMERGYGKLSTYLECFEWFLAPTDLNGQNPNPSLAPHVIINSWGCPPEEGCNPTNFLVLEQAVNNLKSAGIVVVLSSGNDGRQGCESISEPAAIYENSFTVGATNPNDQRASFSSVGPVSVDGSMRMKPNVVAPGVQVLSAVKGNRYASWGGTSMAGPHVAGAVALVISANPDLAGQVEEIESILEESAVPLFVNDTCGGVPGSSYPNPYFGFGRIDVHEAVKKALQFTSSAKKPSRLELDIFPNPIHNLLQIDLRRMQGGIQVNVFNLHGQLISQRKINGGEIIQLQSVSWPTGMYYLDLIHNRKIYTGKVLKL